MVGKNNDYLRETKSNEHFRRFSLRKLSVGVVSVTVAAGFYLGSGTVAQASTTEDALQDAVKIEQVVQQDTDSATDTVTDAVAASDSSSVSDSADSVSSAASDSDSTATSNVASDDNQAASVSASEEDSQVAESAALTVSSASAVSSEGKDAQAASEVSSQSATESQATQSLTSASATSANESASNAATSSSSNSSESKDVPVASEAGSQSTVESQTTQLPTSAASAIELTNGVQQAATSQQTPAGFTVSDPTYPEGIYKDPDTTHYTYWWIQSSDGRYNIVLSTNRTGDGTVYAFLLDKDNNQLGTYTVDVNKSQEITYGTGRSEINLGTIYNDGESGVFVTNESDSRRRWVSKFDVFYPNATADTSKYFSISFMIPKVKTQTTTYVTPDGTIVSDSVVQTGLAGQSYTTSGKVIEGYFAINPSNGKGYMSPFGTLNATYTKDWHDGVKAEFTEINIQTGLMHVKVYDGDSIIEEFDLEYGKSKTVKTSQGTLNVHSIYIPQTINIQYVYQKLGNVVISSNDKAFPAASKVTTQYPNDETDSTKAGDVTIPKIEGFKATINGKVVTNYTFNPSDYVDDLSKDINVVYVAEQTAVIKFYDETTKQFLDTTINLTGETGEKISHTEANAALAKLEKQGYVSVRTDFTDDATYDNDASVTQTFTFYLKHGHAIVTPEEDPQNGQTTVTQTIKYQYADGTSTGQPDNVQTLTFQRTGDKDLVTGEVTWPAWSTIASQQTQVVTSPTIKGYTASQSEVPAQTYQGGDQDAIYVVKYTADAQHAKIEYIDGETGEVVYTEQADGHTDETISFAKEPSAVIKDLESKGYVFDKDNAQNVILAAGTTYDNDTGVDQVFKYYFKHGHAIVTPEEDPQNGQTTVTQTIKYQYADGTPTGQPDNVQTLTFQRTGDKDLVTGEVTWPAWSTIASQQTQVVTSPTIKGYTASQSEVLAQMYQADAQDAIYVVKYTADAQHAKIEYIDGETGEVLYTEKADGHTDETISFTKDPSDVIKELESKGHVFNKDHVDNIILVAGTTYNNDSSVDQVFKYHFKHNHAIVTPEEDPQNGQITVTQTIKYQYADGTPTGQPDNVQTLTFQRTGDKDLVTGKVTWPAWSTIASQHTQAVTSPTIKGYTASQSEVPAQTYQGGDQDAIYVVKYTADAQHAKIEYIDGETGEVVYTEQADGHTDETISFAKEPSDVIKDLESKGYVFDKDNAQNVILAAGTTYDNDTGVDQAFKYYFKHGHAIVTPEEDPQNGQTTVTQTIKYQYADGTPTGQPDNVQTLTFQRTGDKDLVTGEVTWPAWSTIASQQTQVVTSPTIKGYTASQSEVPAHTYQGGNQDVTYVVKYTADAQHAEIEYIDGETGEVLYTEKADGHTDETISFAKDPSAVIKDLESKGYVFDKDHVKNSLLAEGTTYDNDSEVHQYFKYHFKHATTIVTPDNPKTPADPLPDNPGKNYPAGVAKDDLNKTITRTITITTPDGKTQTITQTAEFTRTATVDEVTGEITYGPWSKNVVLSSVDVPNIPGYEPSATIPEITVTPDDHDMTVNITYKKIDSDKATDQGDQSKPSNGGQITNDNVVASQATNDKATTNQTSQPSQAKDNSNAQQLPQTGNANDEKSVLGLVGAMLAAGLGLGFGSKKKRKEN